MNQYIVGLEVGGIMEQPHFTYRDIQTISAESEKEAEKQYNKTNNCSYFYGKVIGTNGVRTIFDESPKHNSFS